MKVRILMFLAMTAAACLTAQAGEDRPPASFEQRKAEQLGRVEERMNRLLAEKACIQEASSHEALKACRERYRGDGKRQREKADKRRVGDAPAR